MRSGGTRPGWKARFVACIVALLLPLVLGLAVPVAMEAPPSMAAAESPAGDDDTDAAADEIAAGSCEPHVAVAAVEPVLPPPAADGYSSPDSLPPRPPPRPA